MHASDAENLHSIYPDFQHDAVATRASTPHRPPRRPRPQGGYKVSHNRASVRGRETDRLPILVFPPTDRPTPYITPVTPRASHPLYPPWPRVQTERRARLRGRPYDARSRPQQERPVHFSLSSIPSSILTRVRDWWLRRSSGVMIMTM